MQIEEELRSRLRELMISYEAACTALADERRHRAEIVNSLDAMRAYVTIPMHETMTAEVLVRELRAEREELQEIILGLKNQLQIQRADHIAERLTWCTRTKVHRAKAKKRR